MTIAVRAALFGVALLVTACGGGGTSSPNVTTPALIPMAGSWDLEIYPSPICQIAVVGPARYILDVTESPAGISVQIRNTTLCYGPVQYDRSSFARTGNTLYASFGFESYRTCNLNNLILFAVSGPGTITQNRVDGSLKGVIDHQSYDPDERYNLTCTAADHRFTMTRR